MPVANKEQTPEKNCDCQRQDGSWLYIRYVDDKTKTDFGVRPLAPETRTWKSPSIFFGPLDKFGNVQAGVPTTVTVRIHNGGSMRAYNVFVEFWWFDPTLAFSDKLTHQFIGSTIVNIAGNSYRDVPCPAPWIPAIVNSGHECLVVQCRSPSEGSDDLKHPFDALQDRHVGQHNLMVAAGPLPKALTLTVANPFSSTAQFAVRLQTLFINIAKAEFEIHNVRDMLVQLAGLVPTNSRVLIANQNVLPEVMDVTQREFGVRIIETRKGRKNLPNESDYSKRKGIKGENLDRYIQSRAILDPDFDQETIGRVLTEITLTPGEVQEMEIEVPAIKVSTHCFIMHHFMQVVAGCVIGGYTIIVPYAGFERAAEAAVQLKKE